MSDGRVLTIAKQLAALPHGVDNRQLAEAAQILPRTASKYLFRFADRGVLFGAPGVGRPGVQGRFFDTEERAKQWPSGASAAAVAPAAASPKPQAGAAPQIDSAPQRARELVRFIDKQRMASSVVIAEKFGQSAEWVDALLAPLVKAARLVRVDVMREGVRMFDYRLSAVWVPKDEDFAACAAIGAAPVPTVGAVAPATPTPLTPTKLQSPAQATADLSRAGASGARSRAAAIAASRPSALMPAALGWKVHQPASEPEEPAAKDEHAASAPDKEIIDATDIVIALNSRGELALEIGDDRVVRFQRKHALVIARFMNGTHSWLAIGAEQ